MCPVQGGTEAAPDIADVVDRIGLLISVVVVAAIVTFVWWRRRRRRSAAS